MLEEQLYHAAQSQTQGHSRVTKGVRRVTKVKQMVKQRTQEKDTVSGPLLNNMLDNNIASSRSTEAGPSHAMRSDGDIVITMAQISDAWRIYISVMSTTMQTTHLRHSRSHLLPLFNSINSAEYTGIKDSDVKLSHIHTSMVFIQQIKDAILENSTLSSDAIEHLRNSSEEVAQADHDLLLGFELFLSHSNASEDSYTRSCSAIK
ncbi:uncharacterized protein EV420DRAFT_1651390 [Desarmillaria tabescens]|uniref:Uncharacterized protein n=1 Tax=Armillaria tabescens TaxID=1929756 RepID=A0AA39J9A8_ARMTA|nr:uncharacterized protein EV420DRAFT_1651390 [Desarmillaria tabescens]KAK0438531.1 hypothetical protein EV420DRAFT_1651390 [Desarmillaria tabescens]